MVITLTGYRGCGKSSVAPLLAQALGWSWADSDAVIEDQAGCSIRRIFEDHGEADFREREFRVLQGLLTRDRLVLAAGGGAVLAERNRRQMRAAGPVVWLQVAPEVLARRISGDVGTSERRPSLTGLPAAEEVARVLQSREPVYRGAATVTVDAETLTPAEIVEVILAAVLPVIARESPR